MYTYISYISSCLMSSRYLPNKKKKLFWSDQNPFRQISTGGITVHSGSGPAKAVEAAWPPPSLPSWWFFTNPPEKYAQSSNWIISPGEHKKISRTTTTFTNLPFGICAIYLNHIATGKGKGSTPKDRGRDGYKNVKIANLNKWTLTIYIVDFEDKTWD